MISRRFILGSLWQLRLALADDVARSMREAPFAPVVVLVGSYLHSVQLRRMLAEAMGGHLGVEFVTFRDLARTLGGSDLARSRLTPLPAEGGELVVRKLLDKLPEGSYFSGVARSPHFPLTLLRTFNDLREAGFSTWPLSEEQTHDLARSAQSPPEKLTELAGLFDDYCRAISGSFYDDVDLLKGAAENASAFRELLGTGELLIYGIYDFSSSQRNLVEACAGAVQVTAYVPELRGGTADFAAPVRDWFNSLDFVTEKAGEADEAASDVQRVQRSIFGEHAVSSDVTSDGTVELVSAPGEVREAREIARRVLDCAENGTPFHRIGIILRQPGVYGPLLADLFERMGIPCFLRHGRALSTTPAGRHLRAMLDLVGSELNRVDVMDFLSSMDFSAEESPSAGAGQWERLSRRAGIVAGAQQWLERLSSMEHEIEEQIERRRADERSTEMPRSELASVRSLKAVVAELFDGLESIPLEGTWTELADATADLFDTLAKPSDDGPSRAVRDLAALDAVDEHVEFSSFREAALRQLDRPGKAIGKFGREGVCICDHLAARGLRFDAVFVPGLVEKAFPQPARQDPILLDAERDSLNRFVERGRVVTSRRRSEEEAVFFALAAQSASKRLVLSYPRIDAATSRERIPSSFVLRLAEALTGRVVDYGEMGKLPWHTRVPISEIIPAEPSQALCEPEYDLFCAEAAASGEAGVGHLLTEYPTLARAAEADELRWGRDELTAFDGCTGPDDTPADVFCQAPVAPTRLEKYARCPFAYFAQYVLQIREQEDPAEADRISPLDRGSLVHKVLEGFFSSMKRSGMLPLSTRERDKARAQMRRTFEREAEALERSGVVGYPLLWKIERDNLLNDLLEVVQFEIDAGGAMVPHSFELKFGRKEAVECRLDETRSIRFRGRIDRMDIIRGEQEARVIDYKTGASKYKDNTFRGGQQLQLPVYLLAARKLLDYPLEALTAEYRKVSPFTDKVTKCEGSFLREREKEFRRILTVITDNIAAGLFPPWPEDVKTCRSCPHSRICRPDTRFVVAKKAERDERMAELAAIRDEED